MAGTCSCNAVVFGNTGEAACNKIQDIARNLILTTTFDANGASKSVSLDDLAVFATGIQPNLVNADIRERYYPLKNIENVENLREDSVFTEFNSGRRAKVREGFKRFTGWLVNAPYGLKGELEALGCNALSAFIVDKSDNLIGYSKQDVVTNLSPIRISEGSLDVKYIEPTDSDVGGIMVSFDWAFSQKDECLYVLSQADLDWQGDDLQGLITSNYVIDTITTTSFNVSLQSAYGENISGLTAGAFSLAELTPTPAAIVIDSVTETSEGVYAIDFTSTAQTSGDVLQLTVTQTPYDFGKVNAAEILIP